MARLSEDFSLALPELSKAVFSQPTDSGSDSKITLRPVLIKGKCLYQAESFRGNKAFHSNFSREQAKTFVKDKVEGCYRQALIVSGGAAAQYSLHKNGSYKKKVSAALPRPAGENLSHNREKKYILNEGENIPAFVDLGIFTADYKVVRSKYNKYNQINRFVELIDDEFRSCSSKSITILDFGCGKSYLTFILYYYFSVKKGMDVKIIGYDLKQDVVEKCNRIAEKYGYGGLRFVCADVSRDMLYGEDIDMIVTLHACDTATDYALYYAAEKKVKHIFSVPCCQHEVNNSIKKGGELDVFLRHGIIKERMSALLTDALRAGMLEDLGYKVDMIEFTDFEHSPKNIMIRARRTGNTGSRNTTIARELSECYGFNQTLLSLLDGSGKGNTETF